MTLTIGSLFSGIGGLELGLDWAGLGPVLWQCEIDPFCRAVLAGFRPTPRGLSMSRARGTGRQLTCFAVNSRAKMSQALGSEAVSAPPDPASGTTSPRSLKKSRLGSSSSKTSLPEQKGGCPRCGATCTCWISNACPGDCRRRRGRPAPTTTRLRYCPRSRQLKIFSRHRCGNGQRIGHFRP